MENQLGNKSRVFAKKSLGQHFLNNENIIEDIISSCFRIKEKNVLEIGPGNLALTSNLVNKAKSVLALEKDSTLEYMLERLKKQHPNFDYLIGDALHNIPLEKVEAPRILVSNLPYNVGTQIFLNYLMLTLDKPNSFDYFILMFQKEVANRITAKAGDKNYGRLSIISSLLADCEVLFDVSAENFTPAPKVTSSVIYVRPLNKVRYDVELKKLEKVTTMAFNAKRKTLHNALKSMEVDFVKLGINSKKRPEEISVEDFCKIANHINS